MVELVDTADLKSASFMECGFEPRLGHSKWIDLMVKQQKEKCNEKRKQNVQWSFDSS